MATQLENSAFKVHTSIVPDVSQIAPESGAIVLSEHDGRLYYADDFGWHLAGQSWSPVTMFVIYDGVEQFTFGFKAPATSTLIIHDGDGAITDVPGNDGAVVEHTTNYAAAGTYYFTVLGDWPDITDLFQNTSGYIIWDVTGMSELKNLTQLQMMPDIRGEMIGDLSGYLNLGNSINFAFQRQKVLVDVSLIVGPVENFNLAFCDNCYGDLSKAVPHLGTLAGSFLTAFTRVTFDNIVAWNLIETFFSQDCGWSSVMVDNCLISLANGGTTGQNINIGGNNASRTAASNSAMITLLAAGNTITVNETHRSLSAYQYNGIDNYSFVKDNGALDIVNAAADFCLCAWIKAAPMAADAEFCGKLPFAATSGRYGFGYGNSSDQLFFFFGTDSDFGSVTSGIDVSVNQNWNHILARVDIANNLIYMYANGALVNPGGDAFTGSFLSLAEEFRFQIGAGQDASGANVINYGAADLRDVRVYFEDVTGSLTDIINGKQVAGGVAVWPLGMDTILDRQNSFHLTDVNNPEIV